jgi:hypothetical protein
VSTVPNALSRMAGANKLANKPAVGKALAILGCLLAKFSKKLGGGGPCVKPAGPTGGKLLKPPRPRNRLIAPIFSVLSILPRAASTRPGSLEVAVAARDAFIRDNTKARCLAAAVLLLSVSTAFVTFSWSSRRLASRSVAVSSFAKP